MDRQNETHPYCSRLAGKVAVVTASTDGIGLAIARRLAQEGAKVVVSSRKPKNVDRAVEELKKENLDVTGVTCHAGSADDRRLLLETAVKVYGGIDILVSNAAVNPKPGPAFDTTPSVWDKVFDVNTKTTFFLIKEVVPYMERRGGGAIVMISTGAAYTDGGEGTFSAYTISKTSLLGMVCALVPQLTKSKIRINAIAPGLIKTGFSRYIWSVPQSKTILRHFSMKRVGRPEEIAGPAAFLVSDDSSYITGETMVAVGGYPTHL